MCNISSPRQWSTFCFFFSSSFGDFCCAACLNAALGAFSTPLLSEFLPEPSFALETRVGARFTFSHAPEEEQVAWAGPFFPPHKAATKTIFMSLFCRRWNVGVQFCPEAHYQLGLILPKHKGWQNVMLTCRLLHLSAGVRLSVRLMYVLCAHLIISWRIVSAYSLFVLWLSKLQDVESVLAWLQLSCLYSVMCNVTMVVLSWSCLWALFIRLSLGHTDTTQSLNAVLCIFNWGWGWRVGGVLYIYYCQQTQQCGSQPGSRPLNLCLHPWLFQLPSDEVWCWWRRFPGFGKPTEPIRVLWVGLRMGILCCCTRARKITKVEASRMAASVKEIIAAVQTVVSWNNNSKIWY